MCISLFSCFSKFMTCHFLGVILSLFFFFLGVFNHWKQHYHHLCPVSLFSWLTWDFKLIYNEIHWSSLVCHPYYDYSLRDYFLGSIETVTFSSHTLYNFIHWVSNFILILFLHVRWDRVTVFVLVRKSLIC